MEIVLKKAIETAKNLEMIYQDDSGNITHRIIKVIEIKESHVVAYCYLRRGKRTFKMNNILSVGFVRIHKRKGA